MNAIKESTLLWKCRISGSYLVLVIWIILGLGEDLRAEGGDKVCVPCGAANATISLTTQAQVDLFNCTEVLGNLTIAGSGITNLNGLNELTSVWGDLNIYNNIGLTSLSGLDNITSVGG
ncbi:MAG TPA: hypothetical protein PKD18_07905, partial [Saprospiraceae bacterium]|nr:hypothetical protein [Saprospiraceae bacterium]